MHTVKIGIYDEEQEYADRLSVYLNRKGAGRWAVFAYTDSDLLEREVKSGGLDLISGTDREMLYRFQEENGSKVLWLRENAKKTVGMVDFPSVCRYQGAELIAGAMERLIDVMVRDEKNKIPVVAVYSPVGRCGKTELSMQLVKQEQYGRWLYIGMEDYSFLWEEGQKEEELLFGQFDSFLYYIKERNEEQLTFLLMESQGIIPSAFSPFDTKYLEEDDFRWLLDWLQRVDGYEGVIFDLGTGVLSELTVLNEFDSVVVPFLQQEKALKKLEQFKALLNVYGLMGLSSRVFYVNMESEEERRFVLERIGGGKWEQ